MTSKLMNVRALPIWMRLYTVGPHTYMPTLPRSSVSRFCLLRVFVS